MFTAGAFVLFALIAWYAHRKNEQDRSMYDQVIHDDREWLLLLHIRQDLKLASFLMCGILVMLGVIADRIG